MLWSKNRKIINTRLKAGKNEKTTSQFESNTEETSDIEKMYKDN